MRALQLIPELPDNSLLPVFDEFNATAIPDCPFENSVASCDSGGNLTYNVAMPFHQGDPFVLSNAGGVNAVKIANALLSVCSLGIWESVEFENVTLTEPLGARFIDGLNGVDNQCVRGSLFNNPNAAKLHMKNVDVRRDILGTLGSLGLPNFALSVPQDCRMDDFYFQCPYPAQFVHCFSNASTCLDATSPLLIEKSDSERLDAFQFSNVTVFEQPIKFVESSSLVIYNCSEAAEGSDCDDSLRNYKPKQRGLAMIEFGHPHFVYYEVVDVDSDQLGLISKIEVLAINDTWITAFDQIEPEFGVLSDIVDFPMPSDILASRVRLSFNFQLDTIAFPVGLRFSFIPSTPLPPLAPLRAPPICSDPVTLDGRSTIDQTIGDQFCFDGVACAIACDCTGNVRDCRGVFNGRGFKAKAGDSIEVVFGTEELRNAKLLVVSDDYNKGERVSDGLRLLDLDLTGATNEVQLDFTSSAEIKLLRLIGETDFSVIKQPVEDRAVD